ncbi:GntT/GntP/DsdX family permease [Parasporobacterium paucivorans]|uniref:H+/gluconate symporter n=1 Tax=Parasporobacterium paucivorans DSM 15970 TaxID=1122934 RepID=A0A1M6DJR0_9FIRM|nr:GntP family permease [Parasporobacterium paucivorans]SHI73496.1 H+/gluconate symporter [Parasporobacterium paucivorans DSM 15970]
MSIGLIGIIIALVIFLLLTYKGFSTFYVSVICAVIVAVTNSINPLTAFSTNYVTGLVEIITSLFAIIFLGAILGKLFTDTGAAASIANTLIKTFIKDGQSEKKKVVIGLLILLIFGGLCTMGGIDAYIQVFTLFPVTLIIAEACNIPRRFVPGMITLNCAFVAAPGAPQIMNVLAVHAMQGAGFTEVSSTSGLIPGLVALVIIAVGGYFTLLVMIMKDKKNSLGFEMGDVPAIPHEEGRKLPPFILALLPLIAVFVCYTIIHWNIAIALTIGILINLVLMQQYIPRTERGQKITGIAAIRNSLNFGADNYPGAMMMIGTPAAFAGVITATQAFGSMVHGLSTLQINIMMLAFVAVAIIVLFTSSPPAALMISLPMIVGIAAAKGLDINPHLILRIAVLTSITFESLPWNGTILLMQKINHTNHKQSYMPYFWQTVVWTTVAALAAVVISIAAPGLN